jgi:DNA polymerase-3 subunit epsilon
MANKRQIVLDTETTGLEPSASHRIIEIGCIEMINRRVTNNHYHVYINPQRDIEQGAMQVHGITNEFLNDKPLFADIVDDFIAYVDGAELIIHNAPFDIGFINHEFRLLNRRLAKIDAACPVIDTLQMARKMHPGQRNSLDALCKRYGVDNSGRNLHGALIDADLLAATYLAMTSGQDSLFTEHESASNEAEKLEDSVINISVRDNDNQEKLKIIYATAEELSTHADYLQEMQVSGAEVKWLS